MKDIMDWDTCKDGFIREVEPDTEKVASLVETAQNRLDYLKSITVNKDNSSFIVEGYYEVIKELLTALLLAKGLRSKNHQCLISYFYRNYPDYEAEAYLIARMGYLRNRLDYYGETIELEFYKKNYQEFINIISLLNKIIRGLLSKMGHKD